MKNLSKLLYKLETEVYIGCAAVHKKYETNKTFLILYNRCTRIESDRLENEFIAGNDLQVLLKKK